MKQKDRHMDTLMDLFITVTAICTLGTIAWIIDGYLMGDDNA